MNWRLNFSVSIALIMAAAVMSLTNAAEPNLVEWWKLDNGIGPIAADSISDNHGIIRGGNWTNGQIDGALEFDGYNDYVFFSENAITTTEFTVAAWANHYGPGGGSKGANAIFQQRDDTGPSYCLVNLLTEAMYSSPYANAMIKSSNGSVQKLQHPKKGYNQWHHYAMILDSNDFIFYIDGEEVARAVNNQLGDYVTSIDYVDIGRQRYSKSDMGFFNGAIDDVRIYNRGLSAAEVRRLYEDGADRASMPSPGDRMLGVASDVVLKWKTGNDVNSHDIYFGTSYKDVNDAMGNCLIGDVSSDGQVDWCDLSVLSEQWLEGTECLWPSADLNGDGDVNMIDFGVIANHWMKRSVYEGSQDVNSFDPSCLKLGRSYYWRVDEINDINIWPGDVWSFTVIPRTAYNPNPADEANAVAHSNMSLTLSWSPGIDANSYDVYFGTDYNNVNDANTILTLGVYKGNRIANSYNSGSLQSGTRYYWRIDEVNGLNIWKGPVWSFTAKQGVNLGVMSFNILNDEGIPSSDPDAWICTSGPNRRDRVIAMILSMSVAFGSNGPDILGVQEALNNQVNDLKVAMSNYDFYGVGRNDGVTAGEYAGIFYRSSRFSCIAQGTFWLSYTPDVPGSYYPGAQKRIASWVILSDNMTGRNYFVLNTHWENDSQAARLWSAELIRQRIKEYSGGLPLIVTGDLNCHEDSEEFLELKGQNDPTGFQLLDTYREVFPGGTSSRIDFVLHTSSFEAVGATIETAKIYGRYPSDHRPVTGTLYMAATSEGQ